MLPCTCQVDLLLLMVLQSIIFCLTCVSYESLIKRALTLDQLKLEELNLCCCKCFVVFKSVFILYYSGYANEVGESFRALMHVKWVWLSYGVACAYVCADAGDKRRKADMVSSVYPLSHSSCKIFSMICVHYSARMAK